MTTDFTRCRTYGHSWIETMDSDWRSHLGAPLTLRCDRCATERHDVISTGTGEMLTRRYRYPQGYSYYGGSPRPTRSEFRLQLLALRITEARDKRRVPA